MARTAFNPNQAFDPVPGEYQLAIIPLSAQNGLNAGGAAAWGNTMLFDAPTLNSIPNLSIASAVITLPRGMGLVSLEHSFEDLGQVVTRGKLRYRLDFDTTDERVSPGYSRNTGTNPLRRNTDHVSWPLQVTALSQLMSIQTGRGGNTGTLTTDPARSHLTILWRALPF